MWKTPVNIKLSLSRRLFDQNEENPDPKLPFYTLSTGQQKTSHATVPLKGLRRKERVLSLNRLDFQI
jgi:hypothetical protein